MSNVIEFQAWPKTPRLFRDITITEKIDGTNAAVQIVKAEGDLNLACENVPAFATVVVTEGAGAPDFEGSAVYYVAAQSRKRLIKVGDDNFGFAAWVADNRHELVQILGEGTHYGEWWGSGIQRGYGLVKGEKRFSLFNVHRYSDLVEVEGVHQLVGLDVVPTLYQGPLSTFVINGVLDRLEANGSEAAPGFGKPEGVIVYHSASRSVFKALLENDAQPKGLAA